MLKRIINIVLLGGGKVVNHKKARYAVSSVASEGIKKGTKVISDIKAKYKRNEILMEEMISQLEDKIEDQQKVIELMDEEITKLKEELFLEKEKKKKLSLKEKIWRKK